jgi:hypothetical protein
MTGKKGGLPVVIADKSQESRFFTVGAILLVEKNGRAFFLIMFSW